MVGRDDRRKFVAYLVVAVGTLAIGVALKMIKVDDAVKGLGIVLLVVTTTAITQYLQRRMAPPTEKEEALALIETFLMNTRTDMSTNVLGLDQILQIEKKAVEIWVYAYDLEWESEGTTVRDVILANLKAGVRYRYIVPRSDLMHARVRDLRSSYGDVQNVEDRIIYKWIETDGSEGKLIQFGVVIYNPSKSIQNSGGDITKTGGLDKCIAVFYPHYKFYGPNKSEAPFIAVSGRATVEIMETFLREWSKAVPVPQ